MRQVSGSKHMKRRFTAKVSTTGEPGTAAFIAVPDDVMAAFAPRKRIPARVTINGFAYRTTVCDMGLGPMIGLRKSVCEAAKIAPGDTVEVALQLDEEVRTVALPPDLRRALTKTELAAFEAMSYTDRREHVEAIESAKRPQTREKRVALAVEAVRKRLGPRRS
jgi:uncharacterized protein YdeI (YjbR/CyaY-like superfamily)